MRNPVMFVKDVKIGLEIMKELVIMIKIESVNLKEILLKRKYVHRLNVTVR